MGKSRHNRIRPTGRWNPLGNELDQMSDEAEIGPIESVITELQNCNVEEKLNGLQNLAVLSANKDKIEPICRSEIIRIVSPMLCENTAPGQANLPVRQAAAGALRNLSVTGGPDVCEFLVEKDVLTPLLTLLSEYFGDNSWTPVFDKDVPGQLDLKSDIFLQSVNILWNLCESSVLGVEAFNQTNMLGYLIRCLDYKVFGLDIAISVAQFLLVISENNPKTWNVLTEHVAELLMLLEIDNDKDYGRWYLSTLAAGILTNVPAVSAAHASRILRALARILGVDHQSFLKEMLSSLSLQSRKDSIPELDVGAMETADDETEEAATLRRRRQDLPTEADVTVTFAGYFIDAQRVAAEVITNLCSPDEEEWIDADESEELSEGESVCDFELRQNGGNENNLNEGDRLPIDVLEAIKQINIVDQLWQKSQPLNDELVHSLRHDSIGLYIKTKNLRISSLIGLQNLCNSLSCDDLGGPNALYNVWVELGQQVFKGPQDISILEPSTSLMRSALDHLKTKKELFEQMSQTDLELILNGVKSCSVAEIRANWLRMLGTLGCLLSEVLIKLIIKFIIEACTVEEDVWTISEALDALMDMFADNDWPHVVVELNLIESCKELDKKFKYKLRSQKRELKERYPAVQTVRTNFSRFIKYMENENAKLTNNCVK